MRRSGLLVGSLLAAALLSACSGGGWDSKGVDTSLAVGSPSATPSPSASPTPSPSPTKSTPPPKLPPPATPKAKGLTCRHAFVLPAHAGVMYVRDSGVTYAVDGKVWVHYVVTGKTIQLKDRHAKPSVLDVISNPKAVKSAITAHKGTVVQRSWTDQTRIGVWYCS